MADAFVERERVWMQFVVWLQRLDDFAELVHDGFDAGWVAGNVTREHAVAVEDLVSERGSQSLPRSPRRILRVAC